MRTTGYLKSTAHRLLRTDLNYWVSHEHRLVYLSIPKNANTHLKALFLANHPEVTDFDPHRETAGNYNDRMGKRHTQRGYRQALRDPRYTRFVALRDPMERAVSGFLDKVVKKIGRDSADQPCERFYAEVSAAAGRRVSPQTISFSDFLVYITSLPDYRRNKHYRSQSWYVGERQYDYYGDIARMNEIHAFLERRGFSIATIKPSMAKRTRRSVAGGRAITHPPAASAAVLCAQPHFPAYSDFFNAELLQRFQAAYADDIALYCRVRQRDPQRLLAAYAD